jgi:hypothetical protein
VFLFPIIGIKAHDVKESYVNVVETLAKICCVHAFVKFVSHIDKVYNKKKKSS